MPLLKNAVRLFATGRSGKRPLLGRYKAFPKTMFRVQYGTAVELREYEEQAKRGRYSYDLELASNGLVHAKKGKKFEGPNGMSIRPMGPTLMEIVYEFQSRNTLVFEVPEGNYSISLFVKTGSFLF